MRGGMIREKEANMFIYIQILSSRLYPSHSAKYKYIEDSPSDTIQQEAVVELIYKAGD